MCAWRLLALAHREQGGGGGGAHEFWFWESFELRIEVVNNLAVCVPVVRG